ncbi:DUF4386 domain-containing protein [Actinomycetospora sp. CA-053990]|uniref:DUF4386 domain-containing protein n=1 Tax=Actinomycetospora sp. CA-053990 TaxID=3239891 RepID=UPI003D8A8536
MTLTADPPTAADSAPRGSTRRTALLAGTLYLITFIASIPALALYGPVLGDPGYVLGPGPDVGILWGGFLEVITALACIGTAIVLFPVLRRQNEATALGFVASRTLEAATIVVGVVTLLAVVTLRQDLAGATGAEATSLVVTAEALVAVHTWTFLLGPGFMAGVNALLLGSLLLRSRLVPRVIPALGLVGAPLLLASSTATLFGAYSQLSVWSAIATIPIFLWELSLGLWLVIKGFTPSPLTGATGNAGSPPPPRVTKPA